MYQILDIMRLLILNIVLIRIFFAMFLFLEDA